MSHTYFQMAPTIVRELVSYLSSQKKARNILQSAHQHARESFLKANNESQSLEINWVLLRQADIKNSWPRSSCRYSFNDRTDFATLQQLCTKFSFTVNDTNNVIQETIRAIYGKLFVKCFTVKQNFVHNCSSTSITKSVPVVEAVTTATAKSRVFYVCLSE